MKVLINENRLFDLIRKFILDNYSMVGDVSLSSANVRLADGDVYNKNIILVEFIGGKMTHSPSYILKTIKNEINPLFGLRLNTPDSKWILESTWIQ